MEVVRLGAFASFPSVHRDGVRPRLPPSAFLSEEDYRLGFQEYPWQRLLHDSVIGVKVRAVMWSSWLSVHADNDSEETTDFWHACFLEFWQNDAILHQSTHNFRLAAQRLASAKRPLGIPSR